MYQTIWETILTVTKNFKRRYEILIASDRQSQEHVQGDDDMQDDGSLGALFGAEVSTWKLLNCRRGAVW